MRADHYVWLVWSVSFLVPWLILYLALPMFRSLILRVSICTAAFGLFEPIFVPDYWNPPSLFNLAQRTGFDIESFIFSFAIGGIGATLYNAFARIRLRPLSEGHIENSAHRFHRIAIFSPFVVFIAVKFLPWNPIYAAITAMLLGAILAVFCRPDLLKKTLVGAVIFVALYFVFLIGLEGLSPGYVSKYWNWKELTGIRILQFPIEEFLFAVSFGMYWSSVYEHLLWEEILPKPIEKGKINGSHLSVRTFV
jgi:hypothetical protein